MLILQEKRLLLKPSLTGKRKRSPYKIKELILDTNMNCLSMVVGEETKNLDIDVDRLTNVVERTNENSFLIASMFTQ